MHIFERGEEILGNLVASQRARHFLRMTNMWFLFFKEVLKERDYDKSTQFDCEKQRRMNGHVKKMHFQQFLETAASKSHCNYLHLKRAQTILVFFFFNDCSRLILGTCGCCETK